MAQVEAAPIPLTFRDVAACFSDNEWKLLQDWQKELYKTVMEDIRQALISLGPLIAASVFSLRRKENESVWPVDPQDSERIHSPHPSHDASADEVLITINGDGMQQLEDPQEKNIKKTKDHLGTGFPPLTSDNVLKMEQELGEGWFDHRDKKEEGSSPNSDIFPEKIFKIKLEDDIYFSDEHDSDEPGICNIPSTGGYDVPLKTKEDGSEYLENTIGSKSHEYLPAGDGTKKRKRKRKFEKSIQFLEKTSCKASSVQTYVLKTPQNGGNYRSSVLPRSNDESRGGKKIVWDTVFNKPPLSGLHQGTPNLGISNAYKECNSTLSNISPVKSEPNTQQNSLYACAESELKILQKDCLVKEPNMYVEDKPHRCVQCGRCFRDNAALCQHIRTHTGERPHRCSECGKSFNQKGVLIRHLVTHTGERPFACTECEKSFTRKANLVLHQRIHTEPHRNKEENMQFMSGIDNTEHYHNVP